MECAQLFIYCKNNVANRTENSIYLKNLEFVCWDIGGGKQREQIFGGRI